MIAEIETHVGVKQLRAEPRMKVLLTGEVMTVRGGMTCRVHDISRGGACLDTDVRQAIGETVTFRRGPLNVRGTIVWVRSKRFGVRFDTPIRATELLIQMSHSRHKSFSGMSQPARAPVSVAAMPLSPSR